jgi:hypothetical protein
LLHVAKLLYCYNFVTKVLSVTQIAKPNFKPSATYERLLPVSQSALCMKEVTVWRAAAKLG